MAEALDLSEKILDLDEIGNIGHPCWELLQPNPDVHELFSKFNEIFFNGVLESRVNLDWIIDMDGNVAGESYTHEFSDVNHRMKINLNEVLLSTRSRRETIEILLHEMIHTYLIHIDMEDDGEENFHGVNFIKQMTKINSQARLNVTAYHQYSTYASNDKKNRISNGRKKKASNKETTNREKYSMWRCGGNCQRMQPYFGFIWVNHDREPLPTDLMWINTDYCEHVFEKFGIEDNPKKLLTNWECIVIFNEFISKNQIQIKAKVIQTNIEDTNNSFVLDITKEDVIPRELYMNFDCDERKFINVVDYLKPDLLDSQLTGTVCMICFGQVADSQIIEHLKNCSGLMFSLDTNEPLPILKVN